MNVRFKVDKYIKKYHGVRNHIEKLKKESIKKKREIKELKKTNQKIVAQMNKAQENVIVLS